jgi:hypothetical protein
MDPFRTPVGRCALCRVEVRTAELAPLTGLDACERCRTGEIAAAIEAWELLEEHKRYHFHSSTGGGSGWQLQVEVKRPSWVEIHASFSAEPGFDNWFTRIFRKKDPEVGVEAFDEAVRIEVEEEYRATLIELLAGPGPREAVAWLAASGCGSSIGFTSVSAGARVFLESSLPDLDEVRRHLVALSVHLERFAAGDAGPTR